MNYCLETKYHTFCNNPSIHHHQSNSVSQVVTLQTAQSWANAGVVSAHAL